MLRIVQFSTGVPTQSLFRDGGGSPLLVDLTTSQGYYCHPLTGVVTALAGGGGGGGGTVTSVGLATPNNTLSLGGTNPVTTTGTINADLNLAHTNEWTASQNVAQSALVDASTITPNGDASNNFYLLCTNAVGATRTIAKPTNLSPGDVVNFQIKQPSSGGPCAVVFDPTAFFFGKGSLALQPAASTANDASEFYSFTVRADGNLHGVMIGQTGQTGPGYQATSTTSLVTAGSGSKSFATQSGLAYTIGARIRATSVGTGEYMEGLVTSYIGATLTATMDLNSGTGTHADWNINLSGNVGSTGATGSTGSTGPAGPAGAPSNGVNLQTGTTYTVVAGDNGKLVSLSNAAAVAVTLPQATGSFTSPFVFDIECRGAGGATITPTTSTIDGAASLALATNQGCRVFSDGTNWYTQRGIGGGSSGPAFSAYASASTNIGNGTDTKVLFATEEFDTANCFASSRFTPTVAGYYQINAGCQFRNGTTTITDAILSIYKNGAAYKVVYQPTIGAATGILGISELMFFNGSSDYVEIFGQCSAGAGTNQAFAGQTATRFTGAYIRGS